MADLDITLDINKDNKPGRPPGDILKFEANMRKMLNGDLVFYDHATIEVVVQIAEKKVVTFPKNISDDEQVYPAQDRMMKHLIRKGIIDRATVKGGSAFASIEGTLLQSVDPSISPVKMAVFAISKFMEEEKPEYMFDRIYKKEFNKHLLEPETEDSTELGEVPHAEKKGSMDPRIRPYGLHYRYFYENLSNDRKKSLLLEADQEYDVRGVYYELEDGLSIRDIISRWQGSGHKLNQQRALMVPAWVLDQYKEHDWKRGFSRNTDEEWEELAKSLKFRGWEANNPCHFIIGKNGVAKVGEGNHRLAIVNQEMDDNTLVPVEFHFYEMAHR